MRAVLIALVTLFAAGLWVVLTEPKIRTVEIGQADVGGPFDLTATDGRAVSSRMLAGDINILYFGALSDEGLSTAALQVLRAALGQLNLGPGKMQTYFITLDPETDAPKDLSTFVDQHLPGAVALSGSSSAINALAKSYKLYFKKNVDPSLPKGHAVDHSSLYYVVARDGGYLGHIPYSTNAGEIAEGLKRFRK